MSPHEILRAEVSLLLLKYGRDATLRCLAEKLSLADEDLRQEVRSMETAVSKERVSNKPKSPPKDFDVEMLVSEYPTKQAAVRTLHSRYQNRTFLPELKDVNRFLDRHGKPHGKLKSRSHATPLLFKLLIELPDDELTQICEDASTSAEASSLAVISDQILRRGR